MKKWFEIIIFPYFRFSKTIMKWRCLFFYSFFPSLWKSECPFGYTHSKEDTVYYGLKRESYDLYNLCNQTSIRAFFTLDIGFKKLGKWNCVYYLLLSVFKFCRKKNANHQISLFVFNKNRKNKIWHY